MSLEQVKRKLGAALPPETVKVLDEGSEHRYSCRCETCRRWWKEVGPEIGSDGEPSYGPFTEEEIKNGVIACTKIKEGG